MADPTISYPPEALWALQKDPDEFETEARLLLAMKLYETGKLTTGLAAKLAGVPRVAFLSCWVSTASPLSARSPVDFIHVLNRGGGVSLLCPTLFDDWCETRVVARRVDKIARVWAGPNLRTAAYVGNRSIGRR